MLKIKIGILSGLLLVGLDVFAHSGRQIENEVTFGNTTVNQLYLKTILFAASINENCSGFFISPTRVLTAKHCVSNSNKTMVFPLFQSSYDKALVGKLISSSSKDIAILELSQPHPNLKSADFSGIKLGSDIDRNSEQYYLIGANGSLPLVRVCRKPYYQESGEIACDTMTDPGQSGSALVLTKILNGKLEISVFGAASAFVFNRRTGAARTEVASVEDLRTH